jgi:predicted nucleic acid-binding protein
MSVLVDTNILLRSAQPSHEHCPQAAGAVSKLLRQNEVVCFCSQNIAEFWNVATRPAEFNGLGYSQAEVLYEVASIEGLLTLLPDGPGIYPEWKRIVKNHNVRGVKVYDARLAAVAIVHRIGSILTFNVADFKRFSNINALHPLSLLA